MRVIVVGGGVVGVATAYYLARDGAQVVLVEAEDSPASLASYATGGHIAPGHTGAWASPRSLRTLVRSTYRRGLAYRLHPNLQPQFLRWALGFARNCTTGRYQRNTRIKLRLALYSRQRLIELRETTGISYDHAARGALFFYRSEAGLMAAAARVSDLRTWGIELEVLRGSSLTALDGRLAPIAEKAAGGLYSSIDEVGDTRLFTHRLADLAADAGVQFQLSTTARQFESSISSITGLETSAGHLQADAYVLATGDGAPELTRGLGILLPIFPVRGYTITAPARGEVIPEIGMVDEEGLVATARLGTRVRLGGTAEIGRVDRVTDPAGAQRLIDTARDFFPDGADWDNSESYVCLRPMTTDGPPILGPSPFSNLYLNVGHGHIGWTMACGAGVIIRDLVAGRMPAIDLDGMTASRFP